MTISMSESAHYTLPSFDKFLITGPLTDKRIRHYERLRQQGKFVKAKPRKRKKAQPKPLSERKQWMKEYDLL